MYKTIDPLYNVSMNKKLKLILVLPIIALLLAWGSNATAQDNDPASMAACQEIGRWWTDWARPMGVDWNCLTKDEVPFGDPFLRENGNGQVKVGGWTVLDSLSPISYVDIVVDGDHKWLWHVFAHELGHQWGFRVAGPYGMKPRIMQILRWRVWEEEGFADTFSACLGFMPPEVRAQKASLGRFVPNADMCWQLDQRGLIPNTTVRGHFAP